MNLRIIYKRKGGSWKLSITKKGTGHQTKKG